MKATDKEKCLSGEQLSKFLHISKRKMAYLLQNGYIPCVDRGKMTHRYLVKYSDAKKFRSRMKRLPETLSVIDGKFSSQPNNKAPLIIADAEHSTAFRKFLTEYWKDEPDALTVKKASELVGFQHQRISALCGEGCLISVLIQNIRYCSKESLIGYFSTPKMLSLPYRTEGYTKLILRYLNNK